jgi:type IV secretion system protein TrbL
MAFGSNTNIGALVFKILSIGGLFFLYNNLVAFSGAFGDSVAKLASLVIPNDWSTEFFHDPSAVLGLGMEVMREIKQDVDESTGGGWRAVLTGLDHYFFLYIGWAVLMIAFIVLTLQLFLAELEFQVVVLFSLILFPFTAWKPTNFIGGKTLSAIVGQGINLGLISLVIGMSVNVFQNELNWAGGGFKIWDMLKLASVGVIICFMAIQIPALAKTLLTGFPNLSASGMIQNLASMTYMARTAANSMRGAVTSGIDRASRGVQGARSGGPRAAAGAGLGAAGAVGGALAAGGRALGGVAKSAMGGASGGAGPEMQATQGRGDGGAAAQTMRGGRGAQQRATGGSPRSTTSGSARPGSNTQTSGSGSAAQSMRGIGGPRGATG